MSTFHCPICDNGYSVSIIERHVNLCVSLAEKSEESYGSYGAKSQTNLSSFFNIPAVKIKSPQKIRIKPEASSGRQQHQYALPNVKRIIGTNFIVDGFSWGPQLWCSAWFLTHFHSDHYNGLGAWFTGNLYCTATTANLVLQRLCVDKSRVFILELNTEYNIDGTMVSALDANHCPGSIMLTFKSPSKSNQTILHTGDCRANSKLIENLVKQNLFYDFIYLDNTYSDAKYCFPDQNLIIDECLSCIDSLIKADRHRFAPLKRLFVVGTYLIGKERIALGVSKHLSVPISALHAEKKRILKCIEWPEFHSSFSYDEATSLRLVPMNLVSKDNLHELLSLEKFDQIVGIKPTGWTFDNVNFVKPRTYFNERVVIIDVPYSEHSSYIELCDLLEAVDFSDVIPTVGNLAGDSFKLSNFSSNVQSLLNSI